MKASQILKALRDSVLEGEVTQAQAEELKHTLIPNKSIFTKKQTTYSKRKRKNKLQKIARRNNRGNTKGQKTSGGSRH